MGGIDEFRRAMLTRAAARRRAAEAQAEADAAETQAASLLPGAFLGGRPDGGVAPLLERGERLQEPVWDDPEEPRSKRRRRAFSWFPSAGVKAGKGGGVGWRQQQQGGGGKNKEAVAGAEAREAEERVLGRPATRRAYMSKVGWELDCGVWRRSGGIDSIGHPFIHTITKHQNQDGTPLVWDAPTLLELRAGQHMLTRAVGAGSIRVSVLQKV